MPTMVSRVFSHAIAAAFVLAILASCATKKESIAGAAATDTEAKKKPTEKPKAKPTPTPPPTPKATPEPKPTPQARYVARVSVDGGETTEAVLSPENQAAPTPSPTPDVSTSPTPTHTPAPASGNFITNTWAKIFPPKSEPTLEAAPAPALIKLQPKEGFLTRTWHSIFPPKELPPVAAPPQWIGTIKLVIERDGYALIDSQGYLAISPGETLNSVGSDMESGVLRVTTDRNPPFFIADIVSGKPRAGDRVYSPKVYSPRP
jgi:hypothetical protein